MKVIGSILICGWLDLARSFFFCGLMFLDPFVRSVASLLTAAPRGCRHRHVE